MSLRIRLPEQVKRCKYARIFDFLFFGEGSSIIANATHSYKLICRKPFAIDAEGFPMVIMVASKNNGSNKQREHTRRN